MIYNKRINETPISFIDFETTGLVKGYDRVIEVSVVRLEPGKEPTLVYDTLVNPNRRVSATDIHGITDDDVADAPDFREIAGDLVNAIKGSVVSSYNVYFDMPFLEHELSRSGINITPPHFCMMYMRPLLGIGSKCTLGEACKNHGIDMEVCHIASADVLSTANLFKAYSESFLSKNIKTFGDLTYQKKNYKFFTSFDYEPLSSADELGLMAFGKTKSRSVDLASKMEKAQERKPISFYWDLLKTVVADLVITDDELEMVNEEKKRLNLDIEQVRAIHAKIFAVVIAKFTDDDFLDAKERDKLQRLHKCLDILGWAPGQ
ncbi:hypothetical protein AGMMS50229_20270 [Campylobacterota bacterium]|nr:hypothetical protein AGMMS50229_20270 [Campylobacterota bacterium]